MGTGQQYAKLCARFLGKESRIGAPAVLTELFIIMLVWSWRKWPDILIDFGRELYVPWQLNAGKVLYRDIDYLYGPLSQYWHAFFFKICGPSYTLLIILNAGLLALFLSYLYIWLTKISSRFTAFWSCALVILLFCFSQYIFGGNFNFISPYSHEATHGLVLSFFMIYQLWQFSGHEKRRHFYGAALLLGLVFLTKVEIFLAAFITALFFFCLFAWRKQSVVASAKKACRFFVGAAVPPLLFLLFFWTAMPLSDAVQGMLTPWKALMNPAITGNWFYLVSSGRDDVSGNVYNLICGIGVTSGMLLVALLFSLQGRHYKYRDSLRLFGVISITAVFFIIEPLMNSWIIRSLCFWVAVAIILLFLAYRRSPSGEQKHNYEGLLLLSVFSLFLLAKIILRCGLSGYGFYLSLPAGVVMVVMLTYLIPTWLEEEGRDGNSFRIIALVFLLLFTLHYLKVCYPYYERKEYIIGSGGDKIVTYKAGYDVRGPLVRQTIEWILGNLKPDETFVALPEGVMLNYLTRHASPQRCMDFMTPWLLTFGEENIVKNFTIHSPDYILLIHKNTSDYGVGFFGADPRNGKKIMKWVRENYHPIALFGSEPLVNNKFGIKIMKKNK